MFKEEGGQGMAEYGLIIALVAIAAIAGLTALSGGLKNIFDKVTGTLNDAVESSGSSGSSG